MTKEPIIAATGKCKRLIVTLLTLLLIIPDVAMAKGKYKPDKYDERYEIPFSRLSWYGKTYENGTCETWVDLTDIANDEPPKLWLYFYDASGNAIGWYPFFPINGVKARLVCRPGSISRGSFTFKDYHFLYWDSYYFVFHTVVFANTISDYRISILTRKNGELVPLDNGGVECVFADPNVHHIFESVFECARRRGAVTYKEDPFPNQ